MPYFYFIFLVFIELELFFSKYAFLCFTFQQSLAQKLFPNTDDIINYFYIPYPNNHTSSQNLFPSGTIQHKMILP